MCSNFFSGKGKVKQFQGLVTQTLMQGPGDLSSVPESNTDLLCDLGQITPLLSLCLYPEDKIFGAVPVSYCGASISVWSL